MVRKGDPDFFFDKDIFVLLGHFGISDAHGKAIVQGSVGEITQ